MIEANERKLNQVLHLQEKIKKEKEKTGNDEGFLRPGEHICRVCKKIYPRFCSGKHGNDEGSDDEKGEEAGEEKSLGIESDVRGSSEDKYHQKAPQHRAPYGRIVNIDKMLDFSRIGLVPQGQSRLSALSEKEREQWQKLLVSMKIDFDSFKKVLKDHEYDHGFSGKNFRLYWAKIIGNELYFNIPDLKDRANFMELLQNKYPALRFVPIGEVQDPNEKNQIKQGKKLPSPFLMELIK